MRRNASLAFAVPVTIRFQVAILQPSLSTRPQIEKSDDDTVKRRHLEAEVNNGKM